MTIVEEISSVPAVSACVQYTPSDTAPREARQAVQQFLDGQVDAELLADLLVVTSELVTNAVKHGSKFDPLWLHVLLGAHEVAITVSGNHLAGGAHPIATQGEIVPTAESGRGLRMVRDLCDEFAVYDSNVTIVRVVRRFD